MSAPRRDDGTCWTCAKPRCLGRVGHTVGRLRYAARTTRYAQPRSLPARSRLLWADFVMHGLLHKGGERCQDCGRRYILWGAPNDLWQQVMGGPWGLLCPSCFDRRATSCNMRLRWTVGPLSGGTS